jgi:hypothetical protein
MTSSANKSIRRWEADSAGIRLIDDGTDSPIVINLPTDSNSNATFKGDVETSSLIVNDNLAVRGVSNEIGPAAKLLLSTGTTKANSSPTASVTWDQWSTRRYEVGTIWEQYDQARWGLAASPSTGTPSTFYYAQMVYGGKSVISAFNAVGQAVGSNWATGVGGDGNVFAWGSDIGIFGIDTSVGPVAYYAEAYNTSGVRTKRVFISNGEAWKSFRMAYDSAANELVGTMVNYAGSGKLQFFRYNGTTGAFIGTINPNYPTSWNVRSLNVGSFDFGSKMYIVGFEESYAFRVFNASGVEQTQHSFRIVGNTYGMGGLYWDGSVFWSHNNKTMTLGKHTNLTWGTGVSDTIYYGMTWYDSDAAGAGGTNETAMGNTNSITMLKRAKLQYAIPEYPPYLNTDSPNAARIYAGRSTTTPANTKPGVPTGFWLQGTISSPTKSGSFPVVLSGTNPPTVNDFPASSPAAFQSTENLATPNLLASGDGLGNWGALKFDTLGKVRIGANGNTIGQFKSGLSSLTTDANGAATISHGLGVTPSAVVGNLTFTSSYVLSFGSFTSTTFAVTVWNSSTLAKAASVTLSIYWMATTA